MSLQSFDTTVGEVEGLQFKEKLKLRPGPALDKK